MSLTVFTRNRQCARVDLDVPVSAATSIEIDGNGFLKVMEAGSVVFVCAPDMLVAMGRTEKMVITEGPIEEEEEEE